MSNPIPAGYRLAIVGPQGTILDTIELEGYDLTKSAAAVDIVTDIKAVVNRAVHAAEVSAVRS